MISIVYNRYPPPEGLISLRSNLSIGLFISDIQLLSTSRRRLISLRSNLSIELILIIEVSKFIDKNIKKEAYNILICIT